MSKLIGNKKILCTVVATLVIVVGVLVGMMLMSRDQPVMAGQNIVMTVNASFDDMYGYQFDVFFDETELEWADDLQSSIGEIESIFSRDLDQEGYRLVGGLMVGDRDGLSGKNKPVCEMVFTALRDGMLSDFEFTIERVNVVKSDLEYMQGLEDNWRYKLSIQGE